MKLPPISIVAAMTPKRVIGHEGTMPWKVPSDMKRFKRLTTPGAVVMGPKTFASIGRPLPGRFNIVITTNRKWEHPGVFTAHSVREVRELAAVNNQHELYAIGGTSVYETFMPYAEQMFITMIQTDAQGDTYFPHYYDSDWYATRLDPTWNLEPGDPVPTMLLHYRRIAKE